MDILTIILILLGISVAVGIIALVLSYRNKKHFVAWYIHLIFILLLPFVELIVAPLEMSYYIKS
jgi:hypothetical protein